LTAYLVSLAVFIPISGWMADKFGGRTVFCAAIATFMVSSMLCGFARSFAFFVTARFLQGIGGAMMVPVGRIVIVRTVSRDELITALNYLTVPALFGPLVGPPLGGFITTYLSWRWIFSSTFRSASWASFSPFALWRTSARLRFRPWT
jgi:MFS family permease